MCNLTWMNIMMGVNWCATGVSVALLNQRVRHDPHHGQGVKDGVEVQMQVWLMSHVRPR